MTFRFDLAPLRCDRPRRSNLGSLFAALFFALQPLRVEAVSWVSAWAYPICGFFSILTILSLSQIYRIKKNPTWRSHRQMAGSRSLLVFFDISIFSLSLTLKIHRNQFTGSFIYTWLVSIAAKSIFRKINRKLHNKRCFFTYNNFFLLFMSLYNKWKIWSFKI